MAIVGDRSPSPPSARKQQSTVPRSLPSAGKQQITAKEFKNWLMKFDSDKDGRISRQELRKAIRSRGGWFCFLKSGHGVNEADFDQNGYIDENEIDNLFDFAEKFMGFKFYH